MTTSTQRAKASKHDIADLLEAALRRAHPDLPGQPPRVTRDSDNYIRVRFPQADIGPHYVRIQLVAES